MNRKSCTRLAASAVFLLAAFGAEAEIVNISTANNTLLLDASEGAPLRFLYYGDKVPDSDVAEVVASASTPLDAYPVYGMCANRETAMSVTHPDGNMTLDMGVTGVERRNAGNGGETVVKMADKYYPFDINVHYRTYDGSDVIETWVEAVNRGKGIVVLNEFSSAYLPVRYGNVYLTSFYGTWANESRVEEAPLVHGMKVIKNKDGVRNTHTAQPNVMFSLDGAPAENTGRTIGAALCYGGNYSLRIDTDDSNYHHFFAGINKDNSAYRLAKGETFATPALALTYSDEGKSGVSRNFHRWARKYKVAHGEEPRKVLLNSWEGVYFDIKEQGMADMMADIASMGGELFVMDDGWFGSRNHDGSGLGDWTANREKLPSGLNGFSEKLRDMGLQFGIWIEPEMVNEDSDLYRAHPDWCFQIPGRTPGLERCQLVLDLSRREVRNCLFDRISKVVDEAGVSYVKWDMNRNLSDVWSAALPVSRQGEAAHRYVLGLYELMEKLTGKYPEILWEGCSGGGGRFDAGILCYMPQIWCSDNTDAVERIRIQYGTSFGYPVCAMGAHVSASPNRQTGREVPLETRAEVAMAGTFGYEMDVRTLNETERELVRQQIRDYRKYEHIVREGDYYRLTSPCEDTDLAVWQFVTKDRRESLVSMVILHPEANPPFRRIRVRGLTEDAEYRIEGDDRVYRGSALMYAGLPVPVLWGDYQSCRFYIRKLE